MRRTLVVTALAAALGTLVACSGDEGDQPSDGSTPTEAPSSAAATEAPSGDVGTDAACLEAMVALEPFTTDLEPLVDDLTTAMLSGDTAAQEDAAAQVDQLIGDVAGELERVAGTAQDPELQEALQTFAGELADFGSAIQNLDLSDPNSLNALLDLQSFQESLEAVQRACS